MKLDKRLLAVLCVMVALMSVPFPVNAETAIDTGREVSLTIHGLWDDIPLKSAGFAIYRISAVDAGGELSVLPEFSQFQDLLDIRGKNAQSWHAAALLLEQYILSENISPTARAVTAENGAVAFFAIPQGLYLVLGVHHKQEGYVYSTNPFFVQLPSKDTENHTWQYHVEANAKPDRTEVTIALQIVKQWRDRFHTDRRPEEIYLTLYRDGKEYQKIILPQDGKWHCTLEALSANHAWHVTEDNVQGYETKITREGNTFLIVNTLEKGTYDEKLPQTGLLWWPVPWLLILGTGLVLTGLIIRRKKNG